MLINKTVGITRAKWIYNCGANESEDNEAKKEGCRRETVGKVLNKHLHAIVNVWLCERISPSEI